MGNNSEFILGFFSKRKYVSRLLSKSVLKKWEKLVLFHRHYPDDITAVEAANRLISYVESEPNIKSNQILLADSLYSDDINSIQDSTKDSKFLEPFKLGGRNEFPFVDVTGIGAFASTVPKIGTILIWYTPPYQRLVRGLHWHQCQYADVWSYRDHVRPVGERVTKLVARTTSSC